jgi:hypothetical protein
MRPTRTPGVPLSSEDITGPVAAIGARMDLALAAPPVEQLPRHTGQTCRLRRSKAGIQVQRPPPRSEGGQRELGHQRKGE